MPSSLTWGSHLNLIEKALLDEGNDDFSQSELLAISMNVLREIVSLVPESYVVLETVQLVSGTKQAIPGDGIRFLGPNRYMGTDGATAGSRIYTADFRTMNDLVPEWEDETATAKPEHLIPDPDDPEVFWSYPPNDGTGYAEIRLDKMPPTTSYDADGDWQTETFPLGDDYVAAHYHGVLAWCYNDDSDIPGNTPRSQIYRSRMMEALGLKATKNAMEKQR